MLLLEVAWRNLWRNGARTRLVVGVVGAGILAMVVVNGLLESLHDATVNAVIATECGHMQVHRKGFTRASAAKALQLTLADDPALRAAVLATPGVASAHARLDFTGRLSVPTAEAAADDVQPASVDVYVRVVGVEAQELAPLLAEPHRRLAGGRPWRDGQNELLLHHRHASTMGLAFDQDGAVRAPSQPLPALFSMDSEGNPRARLVTITGSFEDVNSGPDPVSYLPLVAARALLDLDGRATSLVVRVHPGVSAPDAQRRLQAAIGDAYEVIRWDEAFPIIKEFQRINRASFYICVSIFAVVIWLAITNSMTMIVMERTREIGTMTALGMESGQIATLFVLEGFITGALGGLLGGLLGAGATFLLSRVGIELPNMGTGLPIMLRPEVSSTYLLAAWALASFGIALAAVWPAWRAARVDPVEALRAA